MKKKKAIVEKRAAWWAQKVARMPADGIVMAKEAFRLFFFQAEYGIRDGRVTGVQTCALPISAARRLPAGGAARRVRGTRPDRAGRRRARSGRQGRAGDAGPGAAAAAARAGPARYSRRR